MDPHLSWPKDSNVSYYSYDYYNSTDFYLVEPEYKELWFAGMLTTVFYSLIIFISIIGNSFLLWALIKHKGLNSSANLLLLHLTISDLVFTLTLVPWAIYHTWGWLLGEPACKLFTGAIFLGFYSYTMFLTCMTVQRYMAVVHALRIALLDARRRRFYTHLTCTIVWVLSAICSMPEALFSVAKASPDGMLCDLVPHSVNVELTISYLQILGFFLLPFLVITFCYSQILMTIQRCQIKNREHTVWLILFIIVGFFFCWAPYNITIFLYSLRLIGVVSMHTFAWEKGLSYAYYITHILAYSHCCLNPLVQIFGGAKFRRYLPSREGFSRLSEKEKSHTFSSQIPPHITSAAQTNV